MKKCIVFSIACFAQSVMADPLITLFLRPYPDEARVAARLQKKMEKPGTLAESVVKNALKVPQISGIIAAYAGYLDVSDITGQIAFPRMHQKPYLYILVTSKLSPIIMFGNTVDQWELVPGEPARMYKASLETDDETGISFWKMTKEPLPQNNIVPPITLTIFTKPSKIYVPLGITPIQEKTNLLLPDIYVKNGVDIVGQSLYWINLAQYLRPVTAVYKKEPKRYDSLLNP